VRHQDLVKDIRLFKNHPNCWNGMSDKNLNSIFAHDLPATIKVLLCNLILYQK